MFISLNETANDDSELLITKKLQFGIKEESCAEEEGKNQRIMCRWKLRVRRKRRNQNLLRRRRALAQPWTCIHLEVTWLKSGAHTHPTVIEATGGTSLEDHSRPALLLPRDLVTSDVIPAKLAMLWLAIKSPDYIANEHIVGQQWTHSRRAPFHSCKKMEQSQHPGHVS